MFGAVAFGTFHPLVMVVLMTWLAEPPRDDSLWKPMDGYTRETILMWGSWSAGITAGLIAGWAWRSPRRVRFHVGFLSGLLLLVVTFAYTRHMQGYLDVIDGIWPLWVQSLAVPIVALYSTSLSIILILSAIFCDRSEPNVA